MNSDGPITVSFDNELNDHLEAERFLYSKSFLAKGDKVVGTLALCFGLYLIASSGFHWWTVVWLPLALIAWFDLLSITGLRTRILFGRNPKFRETYHLTFSDEDIHFKTASIDSRIQWNHYECLVETSDSFLLVYGKSLYTLVPKRSFTSGEAQRTFQSLVELKLVR